MTWDPRDPMSSPCHECGAEAGASCSPDCGNEASGGAEGGEPLFHREFRDFTPDLSNGDKEATFLCPWCLDDESSCAMCGGHDYECTCIYCQEARVP